MRLVPSKTPWLFKKLFPNYIWELSPNNKNDKVLYLTFDDGPTPDITEWTLNLLKKYKAKATFFCIGNNVEKHPEIFNAIIKEGHSIGNHTNTHVEGWRTKTEDYLEDFKKAEIIIEKAYNKFSEALKKHELVSNSKTQHSEIVNTQPSFTNLFRPPFGQLKNSQGKALIKLGYKMIMWSVISFDWEQYISPEKCLNNVIKNTNSGSIIVFHDSVKASVNMEYTLPKVLDYYSKKGFRFEAITASNFN